MANVESMKILGSMVAFIRNHAEERVAAIQASADQQFTVDKEEFMSKEKERIMKDYVSKLAKDTIALKIERSTKDNALRIENMKKTNSYISKIYEITRQAILKELERDQKKYQNLLKELIIQVIASNLINVYLGSHKDGRGSS